VSSRASRRDESTGTSSGRDGDMRSRRDVNGFTLIEAMIAVTLMALLAMLAVPSFNAAVLSGQLRASANNLVASAHLARSEGIKRNSVVTLCASSNGTSCIAGGWEQGWVVLSGTTVLERQLGAPEGLKISAGGITSLSFQPTGAGATAATFTVCRATPSVGSEERVVTIDATGRPWVRRTTAASCS
jgi:type IV fimbrial biogenesis protein FimT